MESFIVPFFICLGCAITGYFVGSISAKRQLFQNIADDPDRIIGIINQLKMIQSDNLDVEFTGTEVYLEQHGDQFFVFNKTTHLFLGQGSSADDAMKTVTNRFPNQEFFFDDQIIG